MFEIIIRNIVFFFEFTYTIVIEYDSIIIRKFSTLKIDKILDALLYVVNDFCYERFK